MVRGLSDQSEESYKTILQHAGIAIAVLENDMTVSFVNLEFLGLFGRTQKTAEGMKWTDIASSKGVEGIRQLTPAVNSGHQTIIHAARFTR